MTPPLPSSASNDDVDATTTDTAPTPTSTYCISFTDIQQAARRIQGRAHQTPVLQCHSLNNGQHNLYFKVEALQKTGSFKFRGALNAIQSLLETNNNNTKNDTDNTTNTTTVSQVSIVTHSSGNHAQAVALAARVSSTPTQNVSATIVMPHTTPIVKTNAVRAYGGHIVLADNHPLAREEKADQVIQQETQKGNTVAFVHPSEDPRVIAGQGTVCLEMIQQVKELQTSNTITNRPPLDVVIIPVGGGGLAAGNTMTLRAVLGKDVKIVLAEPSEMDDAKRSFESGQLQQHDPNNPLNSCADGLKTTLGPNTWPIVRDFVNDIFTVSEKEILMATKLIWERLKICIEPSAGVGVAVALYHKTFLEKYPAADYPNVGIVLCGGNVDILKVSSLMSEMGL